MERNGKIDFGGLAAARLAGQNMDEQAKLRREGKLAAKPDRGYDKGDADLDTEDKSEEEGWDRKGHDPERKQTKWAKALESAKPESKEPIELPTEDEADILAAHQTYQRFKQGAWETFLRETKDLVLTEEQKHDEFNSICEEYLQDDIQALVARGSMPDWQEFVSVEMRKIEEGKVIAGESAESQEMSDQLAEKRHQLLRSLASNLDILGDDWDAFIQDEGFQTYASGLGLTTFEALKILGGELESPQHRKKFEALLQTNTTDDMQNLSPEDLSGQSSQKVDYLLKQFGSMFVKERKTRSADEPKDVLASELSTDDSEAAVPPAEMSTEAKDWREVKRKTEVYAVGDFHGNIEALEGNLEKLGVIKNEGGILEWIGGNSKLVCQADILADRNVNGFEILSKLANLQEQARKAGGELEVIAGNHDDFLTSFLMKTEAAGGASAYESCRQGGYLGLLELARYGSKDLKDSLGIALAFKGKGNPSGWTRRNKEAFADLNKINPSHPAWGKLKAEREQILDNMRQDPKGRKVLEAMCSMKLVTKKDDTLFIHTNPTKKIVEYLLSGPGLDKSVEWINKYYQDNLRKVLIEGQAVDPQFVALKSLFLDTDNREDFTNYYQYDTNNPEAGKPIVQNMVDKFKKSGVNALVHGHSDEMTTVRGKEFGFAIVSVDMSAYKTKGKTTDKSILEISKNGQMRLGKNLELIRS